MIENISKMKTHTSSIQYFSSFHVVLKLTIDSTIKSKIINKIKLHNVKMLKVKVIIISILKVVKLMFR